MRQEATGKLSHTVFTKLLLVVLLVLCAENIARTGLSIQEAMQLPNLATSLPPIYVALISAGWTCAYAACIFGISRLNPWAPRATIAVSVLYQANLWLNRLIFGRSPEALAVVGFRALLTAATLLVIVGILAWPGTRHLFAQARTYLDSLKK